jgi:hypothetical protein
MSTHYVTCAPIAVLGGFLVVVSQAFAPATLEWVAAGVAIGVIVIAVLWAARRRPRPRPADSRRRDRRRRRADRLRPRVLGHVGCLADLCLRPRRRAPGICAPVAARGVQLASAASAGRPATAVQHGAGGRPTAVLGCVTERHAVREPGETIPLSPGSHHYCVDRTGSETLAYEPRPVWTSSRAAPRQLAVLPVESSTPPEMTLAEWRYRKLAA